MFFYNLIVFFLGITANDTKYEEFVTGFNTIAPITFYYENSPYFDVITEKIRQEYLSGGSRDMIENGILKVNVIDDINHLMIW